MTTAAHDDTRPTVGHFVTPYLFLTGTWIYNQILHNPSYRAVIVAQSTENLEQFPFDGVRDLSRGRSVPGRVGFLLSKVLLGKFPARPYERIAREERFSLMHAHLGWEGARTVHLRRKLDIPHITSFYGRDASLLPRRLYWRRLYKKLFSDGDLFLAEGPHMGRTLESLGCPARKIRVVHLGVDLGRIRFRERRPGPRSEIRLLIAASFREKKGIAYALDAFARVATGRDHVRLRVIGDGPLRPQIEERIARPDLAGRVDLLGYRGYDVYLEELDAAHILLSPSVTATDGDTEGGAPICLLDAQASGLPIVATTHCDIPEVTRPSESALLAPERDAAALADLLADLLDHPERWPGMGRSGRAHMEAEFDIGKQAVRMADLYDELRRAR